jgi:hypothetical protein
MRVALAKNTEHWPLTVHCDITPLSRGDSQADVPFRVGRQWPREKHEDQVAVVIPLKTAELFPFHCNRARKDSE